MGFDILFMVQHYILYKGNDEEKIYAPKENYQLMAEPMITRSAEDYNIWSDVDFRSFKVHIKDRKSVV